MVNLLDSRIIIEVALGPTTSTGRLRLYGSRSVWARFWACFIHVCVCVCVFLVRGVATIAQNDRPNASMAGQNVVQSAAQHNPLILTNLYRAHRPDLVTDWRQSPGCSNMLPCGCSLSLWNRSKGSGKLFNVTFVAEYTILQVYVNDVYHAFG